MSKYFIKTFGCQMNKNDSERIAGLLQSLDFTEANKPEDADFLLINTCSVRQTAEDRVYGFVRNWQKLRLKNPQLVIAITGCMPGRDKNGAIKNKIEGVDLFFGTAEMFKLPEWLVGLGLIAEEKIKNISAINNYLQIMPARDIKFQAFVTIQTGCNNFCAYCIVPYSRGREQNRPVKDILMEIKNLANNGCKEITLLGQVVNNYKAIDKESFSEENPFVKVDDFAALLWEVNQIAGIERVHFTAADPQFFNDAQIKALTLPKQANYLHLPVQSGDNEILKKMNRKYTREMFVDLVKKIKIVKPNIALGTDLVLGFCGETEEQFANTVDLYKQCDFDIAYQAMYSERQGTLAAKIFTDDVLKSEKKKRWQVIQKVMEETAHRKNQDFQNKIIDVLVEHCEKGICDGHSSEMKFIQFVGNEDLVGKMVKIKVTKPETWVLRGELC